MTYSLTPERMENSFEMGTFFNSNSGSNNPEDTGAQDGIFQENYFDKFNYSSDEDNNINNASVLSNIGLSLIVT